MYDIPLVDDTKPVNFIMHLPSGDTVPDDPRAGRRPRRSCRSTTPQVWIKQGDPAVYTSPPPTS